MNEVKLTNEVKISGTICNIKDVSTKTGIKFTTAAIMKNRKDKHTGQWLASFFNIKCFGNVAADLAAVPDKSKVLVDGYLGQDQYTDKKTGEEKSNTYIMVNSFIVEGIKEKTPANNEMAMPYGNTQHNDNDDSGNIPF